MPQNFIRASTIKLLDISEVWPEGCVQPPKPVQSFKGGRKLERDYFSVNLECWERMPESPVNLDGFSFESNIRYPEELMQVIFQHRHDKIPRYCFDHNLVSCTQFYYK